MRLGNDRLDAKRGARRTERRSASCLPIPFGYESAGESTEQTCSWEGEERRGKKKERKGKKEKGE